MDDANFKLCPLCKQQIRKEAVKCRFCGKWLEERVLPESGQPVIQESVKIHPAVPVETIQPTSSVNNQPDAEPEPCVSALVLPKTDQAQQPSCDVKDQPPAAAPTERRNYFVRHWRGDLSLGISYWVNGMLGTFLVLFVSSILEQMRDSISLKILAGLSLVVFAVAILASVWQCVGVCRSATKHESRGGSSGWATAAKVAVVFGILKCIGLVLNNYIPQSIEMVSIIAGDKSIPAYEIRILPGGTDVEYRGGLRAGSAKELEKILSAVPQAKVLHIESVGGRIIEAKAMAKLVRDRGLTTYTSDYCLSAATLVLMSGKERVIGTGAKVGFHAGKLPGATREQQLEMDSHYAPGAFTLKFASVDSSASLWVNLSDPKELMVNLFIMDSKSQRERKKQLMEREKKAFGRTD